jgi:hypothetical protein
MFKWGSAWLSAINDVVKCQDEQLEELGDIFVKTCPHRPFNMTFERWLQAISEGEKRRIKNLLIVEGR